MESSMRPFIRRHEPNHRKGDVMKRTVIAAVVLLLAFAAPVIAVEGDQPPKEPGKNFDQRKAQILKMFDDRIANLERSKTCVQAAKNHEEIKACMENRKAETQKNREENRKPGGPGTPPKP
jgi:hypothetical protein